LREGSVHGPFDLVLELTETCMIDDPETTGARMRELCELGVRFALDDFGTGFSSLSYLRDLPLSIVKIDGAFVAALGTTVEDEAIVRAVVQLGRSLHLQVIAEGVETDEQLARLRALGCERAQGFLLAIPGPAARLTPAMTGARTGALSA
jgi:EAL domain-containing protein (putative c-di-GMP-specific phosphodiesterase class I)